MDGYLWQSVAPIVVLKEALRLIRLNVTNSIPIVRYWSMLTI